MRWRCGGDVTNAADVKGLFDATEAAFGLADILVNNAGVYGMSPLGTIDEASYRRYFDIDVLGLMLATQEAAGRQAQRTQLYGADGRDAERGLLRFVACKRGPVPTL